MSPYKNKEDHKANSKRLYYERKAKGQCPRCIVGTPAPGRTTCKKCLAVIDRYTKERAARRAAAGACRQCGTTLEPWQLEDGSRYCQRCYDKRQTNNHQSNM